MSDPTNEEQPSQAPARGPDFNTVFGAAFVVLSVVLFLIIPDQIEKPLVVFAANPHDLDASLFPSLVAAGFGGLGIWLVVKSFSTSEFNDLKLLDGRAIFNVLVTLTAMALYGPLMVNVGFVVASAVLIAFLSTYFGNRNFILTALIGFGVPIAMFFVFTRLLATYLPPFPIDTFLTRLYIL